MWINAKERLPERDGPYLIQTVYGDISSLNYTTAGGWNTYYVYGKLLAEHSFENDGYIARWFDAPIPEPVPEEWREEYYQSYVEEE